MEERIEIIYPQEFLRDLIKLDDKIYNFRILLKHGDIETLLRNYILRLITLESSYEELIEEIKRSQKRLAEER